MRLKQLMDAGQITPYEYKTYLAYEGNDITRDYLKMATEQCMMEEPARPTATLFTWHDGRRSVWRDIQMIINKVNYLLEKSHVRDK